MNRLILIISLLCFFHSAQSQPWKKIEMGDRFSIDFPTSAERHSYLEQTTYQLKTEKHLLNMTFTDFREYADSKFDKAKLDDFYNGIINGLLEAATNSELQNKRSIQIENYKGYEVEFTAESGNFENIRVTKRFFLVDKQLLIYGIWELTPEDQSVTKDRLFNSLRILEPKRKPIDKRSNSLEFTQNDTHFKKTVNFGTYEFDSLQAQFFPTIDTNSYHANPVEGFHNFGKKFQKVILRDKSFKNVGTNISVSFDVMEDGNLRNFVLGEKPHTNDTAVVRTLMSIGKWDPAYHKGVAAKQSVQLNFKSYYGKIYEEVDVSALPPDDYEDFVSINLFYPYKASTRNIIGFVEASFVVEKDGTITNGEIVEGLGFGCDEQTLKVITMLPNWTPAFHQGRVVRQKIKARFAFNPD